MVKVTKTVLSYGRTCILCYQAWVLWLEKQAVSWAVRQAVAIKLAVTASVLQ